MCKYSEVFTRLRLTFQAVLWAKVGKPCQAAGSTCCGIEGGCLSGASCCGSSYCPSGTYCTTSFQCYKNPTSSTSDTTSSSSNNNDDGDGLKQSDIFAIGVSLGVGILAFVIAFITMCLACPCCPWHKSRRG